MAFRRLTEAECGQVNPINKLTSHITQDHALSSSHGHILPGNSDQLVEQFLLESAPKTFKVDDLMREMQEIESQRSLVPPVPALTVKDQLCEDVWAQQYVEDGKLFIMPSQTNYETIWTEMSTQEEVNKQFQSAWNEPIAENSVAVSSNDAVRESARELNSTLDDQKFVYSKFMKFMKNIEENEVTLDEGKLTAEEAEAWASEYLSFPMDDEAKQESSEEISQKWSRDFVRSNDEEEKSSYWDHFQEEMKKASQSTENALNPWLEDFNTYSTTPQKEYEFNEENPMLDIPNAIERGKQFIEEEDLPSAVLCFEAAVKQQPENPEAWLLLGRTQAENEQDPLAIPALNKCLHLDPTNQTAMMALAVSYTNESYLNQACHMLLNWLKHNPKYQDLVPPDMQLGGQITSLALPANQKIVQDLYLKAVQRSSHEIDYEVQCGLGVLCNLAGEYDKAADCFRTALSVKPNDARLWNRLGATLANGSHPEEAVDAYHHALEISPGYIRARYNVGITCINLNAYTEAAEHFLTALNQQARGKDVFNSGNLSHMSSTIWSTLRMCLSLMNRPDLREAVDNKNLQELNKAFNIN